MTATAIRSGILRRRLVQQLTRDGALRSRYWHEAFSAVPRELFVPRFTRREGSDLVTYRAGDPDYLAAVYSDVSLNTRYDIHGTAVSSSSQPSMMARMCEALAPAGDRLPVLDLGTGPGYNAALLCHRYGSDRVVSRDVDPNIVTDAAKHLAEAGYSPTLTLGNGAEGCPGNAPYGALIATYGTGRIPDAWRHQVARGGNIVANIGNGLVALTIGDHRSATGHFLPSLAAFMRARPTADAAPAPARTYAGTVATATGHMQEIELSAAPGEDMPQFLGSLVHPDVVDFSLLLDGQSVHCLAHPRSRSWARITPGPDGTARLDHGGPRNLWAERAPLISRWAAADQPNADAYSLTVYPTGQHELRLGDSFWSLPE
ncbi:hypothetical protein [Streptomyces catenulae]|uniref:Protein-L-isoaspartate O-methyltransferase n=1 Tax=Streptomyces catenulae TaxID=66875 RepID=A0ABV2YXK2_9ACTN|nr:hypothetical protein [Streptomyces catenulae]